MTGKRDREDYSAPGRPKLRCVLLGHRWAESRHPDECYLRWIKRCLRCDARWNTGEGNQAWD